MREHKLNIVRLLALEGGDYLLALEVREVDLIPFEYSDANTHPS